MSEEAAIAVEQEEAWHSVQRSWTGLLTVYAVLGGVFLVNLVPDVRALLGNSLVQVGIACGAVSGIATFGVFLFYRLGVRSPWYQRYDVVESGAVQLVLNGLIYFSAQQVSPVWGFWMLHTCLAGSANITPRLAWGVAPIHLGLPLLQAILHFAGGDVPRAALALTMSLGGAMGYSYGRAFVTRMRVLSADRVRLMAELGTLKMAEDRRRIARDLHDGLGAELAGIAWRTAALAGRPGSEALADDLRSLTARASSGIDEIRSVVWAADAEERRWSEVVAYLRGRARELAAEDRLLISESGTDVTLPGPFTAHFVRFVLEAMRNAVTHGGAEPVSVKLTAGERIEAEVVNALDGKKRGAAVGSGLVNLKARAATIGGSVELGEVPAAAGEAGPRFVVRLSAPRPGG